MLKVIDGLRTVDGANATCDILPADRTNTTTNGTGVDMADFEELIAVAMIGTLDASHGQTIAIQESDEAAANFANITSPDNTVHTSVTNTLHVWSVDWRHPDRKRYARVQVIDDATDSALTGVATMRCRPKGGVVTVDSNVTEVNG